MHAIFEAPRRWPWIRKRGFVWECGASRVPDGKGQQSQFAGVVGRPGRGCGSIEERVWDRKAAKSMGGLQAGQASASTASTRLLAHLERTFVLP